MAERLTVQQLVNYVRTNYTNDEVISIVEALRPEVQKRLLEKRSSVAFGQYGQPQQVTCPSCGRPI